MVRSDPCAILNVQLVQANDRVTLSGVELALAGHGGDCNEHF